MFNLTPGQTYKFVVKSRNIVGLSEYSASVNIIAAQIPDQPTDLVDVPAQTSASQIGLDWNAPVFEGGASITDYKLWYDNASAGATFTVFTASVPQSDYIATSLTQGQTYQFMVEA